MGSREKRALWAYMGQGQFNDLEQDNQQKTHQI